MEVIAGENGNEVNPNVNYEFLLIHQYLFISFNKYITLMQDIHNQRNYIEGVYLETLYFLLNFSVN